MGKKNPKESEPAGTAADTSKPLPDPQLARRPGTSGTELGLRTERRKANKAYERAQRAEQDYRAKRQASKARTDISAAKAHFKAAAKSGKIGCLFFWSAIKELPGVWGEKRAARRTKREVKRREKQGEKRRKLEERMKMEEEEEKERIAAQAAAAAQG